MLPGRRLPPSVKVWRLRSPPAKILVFQQLFRITIPVAGAVLRSDLWRIEEDFRIPLPETRRCVKLRWDSLKELYAFRQVYFLSPASLPRWFSGFCTTKLTSENWIEVVPKPIPTGIKRVAEVVLGLMWYLPAVLRLDRSGELFGS